MSNPLATGYETFDPTTSTFVDLVNIFEPLNTSTPLPYSTGYYSGNYSSDLSALFAPGTGLAYNTGYSVSGHGDLSSIFAPIVTVTTQNISNTAIHSYPNAYVFNIGSDNSNIATATITFSRSITVNILVVGGGGGGGSGGSDTGGSPTTGSGGGGAGVISTTITVSAGTHNIQVGNQGTGGICTPIGGAFFTPAQGTSGSQSSFDNYISYGGGGGGWNGGSAGGPAGQNNQNTGTGGIGGNYSANGSGTSYITSVTISQLPTPVVIVAGGGGCGNIQYGGYAGLGTGGAIGDNNNGVNGNSGAGYGSGAGGGGSVYSPNPLFVPYTCGNGGNGGNGVVIVYW